MSGSSVDGKDGKQGGTNISQLPIPQLNMLIQQLDREIEYYSSSIQTLKETQVKYNTSKEALQSVSTDKAGNEIMVPMSDSMYVQGRLKGSGKVIIDIGTGYYLEKDVYGAKLFFDRKLEYIQKQVDKIQPLVKDKFQTKTIVSEVLQMKVQSQILNQQHISAPNSTAAAAGGDAKSSAITAPSSKTT